MDILNVVIRECVPEKLMVFENEAVSQGTFRGKAFPEQEQPCKGPGAGVCQARQRGNGADCVAGMQ